MLALTSILKNTMKIVSLRLTGSISFSMLASLLTACALHSADCAEDKSPEISGEKASQTQAAKATPNSQKAGKSWFGHAKAKADKNGDSKEESKSADTELSPEESEALEKAAERARILKATPTPFNVQPAESGSGSDSFSPAGRGEVSSLRSRLSERLSPSARVYLPGRVVIGKASEFVVKGRPGSHAAIAMADKDSGARAIFGQKLRLGPDRKLMAAGIIPESGVLALTVDMPVQGDLIGLPVFFETVIWQKADFSDTEIAAPVRAEFPQELADKANAVMVSEDKPQKRGIRFEPGSGVPLYQRDNGSLGSGRL